jgi:DNA-binding MarR family transcriptional regulator
MSDNQCWFTVVLSQPMRNDFRALAKRHGMRMGEYAATLIKGHLASNQPTARLTPGRSRVLACIQNASQPINAKTIATNLDLSRQTVHKHLCRLQADGRICRVSGQYGKYIAEPQ